MATLAAAATIGAGPVTTVEDWQTQEMGASGVPGGWSQLPLPYRLSLALGDLQIVTDQGRRALRLRTGPRQHTIIARPVTVDLAVMPVLEWSWKVVLLPAGADLRTASRSDSAGVLLVSWSASRQVLGYAWDATQPVGATFSNPKRPQVRYLVVRSGEAKRGHWLTERQDVAADYELIFGRRPTVGPSEVEISVDSNDTRSAAELLIGSIRFVPR